MQSTRRSDRRLVSLPATVTVAGRKMRDVVTNVSPGGIYLEADRHRFRPGERVRVSFSLPISGKLIPLTVEGKVARVVRDTLHRTKGIGVELITPPSHVAETIEAYLAARDAAMTPAAQPKQSPGSGPEQSKEAPEDARLAREGATEYHLDEDEDLTDPLGEPFD